MSPLPPKRRSELRAEAHKLNPTVIIGDKGLTDEVIAEIDRALRAHELIKVRAATDEREARDAWLEKICERLEAHPVQQIGKVFVVYRENPKEEKKSGPGPSPAKAGVRGDDKKRRGRSNERSVGDAKKRRGRDEQQAPRGAKKRRASAEDVRGTSRPRSRTPAPRPASEPRRRRPRTSR